MLIECANVSAILSVHNTIVKIKKSFSLAPGQCFAFIKILLPIYGGVNRAINLY